MKMLSKKYIIVERCEVEYYYIVENATSEDDALQQHSAGGSYEDGDSFVEVIETLIDENGKQQ
jgi:hypothetical protein